MYSAGALGTFSWNGAVGIVPDPNALSLDASGNNPCVPIATDPRCYSGHVDARQIMDIGVMNGNIPAPLVAFDEDDEMFLTLTNVGMIMRPDLFEQHTIHFHGYPNASSVYDGVPDASVAINIGGSFTYYYLAPDAGTYFWHCHITPPEHLQMGMVGQLYVRPRQDRIPSGGSLYTYLQYQNGKALPTGALAADLRTVCNPAADILCSETMPATVNAVTQGLNKLTPAQPQMYVYNDGDGSTAYDTEYALQIHGFDPNFHFVGMTFNPEAFVDMKSKFFLLNGRSYPDTVNPQPMATQSSDGRVHYFAALALDHQHSRGREKPRLAHRRPGGGRIRKTLATLPESTMPKRSASTPSCYAINRGTTSSSIPTRLRWAAANPWTCFWTPAMPRA